MHGFKSTYRKIDFFGSAEYVTANSKEAVGMGKRDHELHEGRPGLRIRNRKAKGKKMARMRVRCPDCEESVDIHYELEDATDLSSLVRRSYVLEINGVMATLEEWRRVLGPKLGFALETPTE